MANFPELTQVSFILAQKVHASCVKKIITKLHFQSTSQPSFRTGKVTGSAQPLPEGTAAHDCPAGYVGRPNRGIKKNKIKKYYERNITNEKKHTFATHFLPNLPP